MKISLLALAALSAALAAHAQPSRPDAAGRALYHEANAPAAARLTRAALAQQPGGFLANGDYGVGYLHLLTGRRVLVPGLRYHVGQRVVQVQDSLQADSTRYWPLAALRGFDLGTEDEPATRRRYCPRLVRESHGADRREAVQVLTATDAGPLLLAWLPQVVPGAGAPSQVLVAGPGNDPAQPLRPLDPTETSVLRLCGPRADQVQAFVRTKNLNYNLPTDIAKMLDYYNRLAVAK